MDEKSTNKKTHTIRKKRLQWNFEQIKIFICIWKEYKEELLKNTRNFHVITKFQERLNSHGISVTRDEIKTKMHNLKGQYRRVRQIIETGGSSSEWEWEWYDDIRSIVGNTNKEVDNSIEVSQKSFSDNEWTLPSHSDPLSSPDSIPFRSLTPEPSALALPDDSSSNDEKEAITKVLHKIETGLETIEKFIKNREEIDKQMLQNQKYLIHLEKRKTKVFEKMYEENMKLCKLIFKKKSK